MKVENVGFSKDRDSAEPGTRTNLSASLGWMGGGSDASSIFQSSNLDQPGPFNVSNKE